MKKAVKGLLKLIGGIMVAAGAVLVVVSYLDELKGLVEKGKALCCRCHRVKVSGMMRRARFLTIARASSPAAGRSYRIREIFGKRKRPLPPYWACCVWIKTAMAASGVPMAQGPKVPQIEKIAHARTKVGARF